MPDPSDRARKAAEEIVVWLNEICVEKSVKRSVVLKSVAAIIERHMQET